MSNTQPTSLGALLRAKLAAYEQAIPFGSAEAYLTDERLATQYVMRRNCDAAEFLAELKWQHGGTSGRLIAQPYDQDSMDTCVIRDMASGLSWGYMPSHQVMVTENQYVAYILARFW
jgi:hypothetical protein